ncbi:GNAT family N-acetyltransferase [Paucibacter sp. AS339]|uniref:GNAT family N-acetyltransferase n=1 Tax=Paucibacter hankyongi TaxID=3133434 RepID=UPI0030B0F31D
MHIQAFDQSLFPALVQAMHELDQHYFGAQGASIEALTLSLQRGLLGADSGVRIVVALDGDEIAALATYTLLYPAPQQRGQLFMKDLFVRQRWRSQGLGEQLMRYLAAYAVQKDCLRFDWTAENGNTGAMAFYERLGAEHVTEKVYYRISGEALLNLGGKATSSP